MLTVSEKCSIMSEFCQGTAKLCTVLYPGKLGQLRSSTTGNQKTGIVSVGKADLPLRALLTYLSIKG